MERGVATRSRKTASSVVDGTNSSRGDQGYSPELNPHGGDTPEPSLQRILDELHEFRRDNNVQLADIKQEIQGVNDRLDEAEERIEETETVLQAASMLIKRLAQRQTKLEARLIDQEGRARRENLRIYGVPENKEGADMVSFLDNLFKKALDLPSDRDLGIERAHRALTRRQDSAQGKPRSIVVKFESYRIKEEILRKAWQKKVVYCDETRFFVDHDFPTEVLKKRNEYADAKKVLKSERIKFQTLYPAKMRVFYDGDTQLYQDAAEATRDMAARGLSVTVVPPAASPDHEEIQLLAEGRKTASAEWRP
uniref:L1 transposable element RRM domain-containing protein n=1 Tax=Pygocentrus nattereri TaxID=42514 RepID=A0AAR2KF39_PYGNA